MKLTSKQAEIAKVYASIASKSKRFPTSADMAGSGVVGRARDHFSSMEQLKQVASKIYPEKFEALNKKREAHPLEDFTREALGSIVKSNDYRNGIFVITAVAPTSHLDWSEADHKNAEEGENVTAENLFEPGFKAIQNYLKRKKAELVLLPMPAHVKALQEQPRHYDARLEPFREKMATEFTFNKHLKALEAHINPQQINPLTGLKRLRVQRYLDYDGKTGADLKPNKTSLIVAHSKQMMEVVPTGNNSHPRIIHSTGSITLPSYLRNRIGMIANEDHKLGALIVEIEGDVFYIRQIQMNPKNGSFVDLGVRYHADGKAVPERAEAFKIGDIHPGHHDADAIAGMFKLWDIIKPKRIFFEDAFDGSSISHHLAHKKLTRSKLPSYFKDLPSEIEMAKKVLEDIWDHAPKDAELIMTASNHPEHVAKYLDEGRYINDNAANYQLAHRMIVMDLDGKNPLQEMLDPDRRMRWTGENEDLWVEGVQMNVHGHLGLNGARGSKQGHELAYGDVMIAHSHTPSIYHNAFTVGHMSTERHGYNNGSSTWILCSGAVYKGGQKQLYMLVKNKFQIEKKKK